MCLEISLILPNCYLLNFLRIPLVQNYNHAFLGYIRLNNLFLPDPFSVCDHLPFLHHDCQNHFQQH